MPDNVFTKDPNAVLDYQWDWSAWLADGETITVAVIDVPTGLTLDSQDNATDAITAWLSGGTVGAGYQVTCHIETSAGREDDRSIYLICRER
jgi:hypothetical protein